MPEARCLTHSASCLPVLTAELAGYGVRVNYRLVCPTGVPARSLTPAASRRSIAAGEGEPALGSGRHCRFHASQSRAGRVCGLCRLFGACGLESCARLSGGARAGGCVCVRVKWGPSRLLSRGWRFDLPYDRSGCNANDRGCNAGSCGCNADSCGCYADRSRSYADRSSTYADGCGSYADRSSRYAGGCGCYADDRRSQRGDRGVGPRRRGRVSGDPLRKDCRWDRGGSGLPIPGG